MISDTDNWISTSTCGKRSATCGNVTSHFKCQSRRIRHTSISLARCVGEGRVGHKFHRPSPDKWFFDNEKPS